MNGDKWAYQNSVHWIYIFLNYVVILSMCLTFFRKSQKRIFKKHSFLSMVHGLSHSLLIWGSVFFMYNLDSEMVLTYIEDEVYNITGFQ